MESVEDIPARPRSWRASTGTGRGYGEYYAALDALPKGINVGGMVGHSRGALLRHGRALHRPRRPSRRRRAGADGQHGRRGDARRGRSGSPAPGCSATAPPTGGPSRHVRAARRVARPVRAAAPGPGRLRGRAPLRDRQRRGLAPGAAPRSPGWPTCPATAAGRSRARSSSSPTCPSGSARSCGWRPPPTPRRQRPPPEHGRGIGILFGARIRSPFRPQPVLEGHPRPAVAEKLAAYADPGPPGGTGRRGRGERRRRGRPRAPLPARGPRPRLPARPARSLPAVAAARGVTLAEAYMDLMVGAGGSAFLTTR